MFYRENLRVNSSKPDLDWVWVWNFGVESYSILVQAADWSNDSLDKS